MLGQDLKSRINCYLDYIVSKGIALEDNETVEIVASSYINDIVNVLANILYSKGAKRVLITNSDGLEIEEEINKDWRSFLNRKKEMYKSLIKEGFARIILISPFTIPMTRTNNVDNYKANSNELAFVYDYFNNGHKRTMAAIPNDIWANKLQISLEELWDRIISKSIKKSILEVSRSYISRLNIQKLYFKTSLGTNLEVGLIDGMPFLGKKWYSNDGLEYELNIPCMEICTSPNRYKVNGVLVASKPLYYKGYIYNNIRLEFLDGKVVKSQGIDDIISLCSTLYYCGEIAVVIPSDDDMLYYNTLLDENTGCHLALGNSLQSHKDTNKSNYHIDIVFGTNDVDCYGELPSGDIIWILKNGKFVLREE